MADSEVVVLRKELHAALAQLDESGKTIESQQDEIEKLRLANADAQAKLARRDERYDDLLRQFDELKQQRERQEAAMQEAGSKDDAERPEYVACLLLKIEDLEEEMGQIKKQLEEYKRKDKRINNAHSSPSAKSESQGMLAKYMQEQDEKHPEQKEARAEAVRTQERRRRRRGRFGWLFDAIGGGKGGNGKGGNGKGGNGKGGNGKGGNGKGGNGKGGNGKGGNGKGGNGKGGNGKGGNGKGGNGGKNTSVSIGLSKPDRREDHTVDKCGTYGTQNITVKTTTKDMIDFVSMPEVEKVQHLTSQGTCENGHKIDTTPKGLPRGSSFGPHIMTLVVCMFFQTLSLGRISECLSIMGVPDVSKAAVLNAIRAVAMQKFQSGADYISRRLKDSWFLMADETPIRIGKSGGYAWVFIGQYGIKIVVAKSRGKIVVDMNCPYFHIPITVDGYPAYGVFDMLQRCWAHILRDAALIAAQKRGNMIELHERLQFIFHNAKKLPPNIPDEELKGWIDDVISIADAYTELGYDYGVKLRNAAPNLFTFVRHPGMEPTNNRSERTLRQVVLHKKIRLMFRTGMGMKVYGILMTCLLTWDDQEHNLTEKVYKTIMAS